MRECGLPANVGSNEGLGVLVERLRACLPLANDGPDHKTWCSVLGSDLREAVEQLIFLRSEVFELRRKVEQRCAEFATMRELVVNVGTEAALSNAEIERLQAYRGALHTIPLALALVRHGLLHADVVTNAEAWDGGGSMELVRRLSLELLTPNV